MKPTNENIIDVLKSYDEYVCAQADTDCAPSDFVVTHREDIPGEDCELVHVKYTDEEEDEYHPATTSVVVYGDCTVFCTEDWDFYPSVVDSICNYNWICANNAQSAILLNGLPRLLM